jgi:hypothetical protein
MDLHLTLKKEVNQGVYKFSKKCRAQREIEVLGTQNSGVPWEPHCGLMSSAWGCVN